MAFSSIDESPLLDSAIQALKNVEINYWELPELSQNRIHTLLRFSPRLAAICTLKPEYFLPLLDDENLRTHLTPANYQDQLQSLLATTDNAELTIRRFHRREIIRIAMRDICHVADIQEITEELSDLAETVIRAIFDLQWRQWAAKYGIPTSDEPECPSRMCIIAMGKLGGRELNFSSDIDLMFVYDGEGKTKPCDGDSVDNQSFFIGLAQSICDLLSKPSSEGFLYRVDTRLRPEGSQGALAVSLMTVEVYYHTYGENWERQALLKARPVAGDPAVGSKFMQLITPFTYRKYVDEVEIAEVLRSIDHMRVQSLQTLTAPEQKWRNFKNGYGGIRDIEFFVQAVQMLYGGQYPEIKLEGTLVSLLRMHESGLLHSKEFAFLADAYRFLRKIEHCLQMVADQQVYELPQEENSQNRLAASLRYASYDALKMRYDEITRQVREIYIGVFKRVEWEDPSAILIDADTFNPDIDAVLTHFEFRDTKQAFAFIKALLKSPDPHLQPKTTRLGKAMLPRLLQCLKKSPDPDMALSNFEKLTASFKARTALYEVLCDEPSLLDLLVSVTSSSSFLTSLVLRDPSLLDTVGRAKLLEETVSPQSLHNHLQIIAAAYPAEPRRDHLLRVQNAAMFQSGNRFIIGITDVECMSRELAEVADFVLTHAMQPAHDALAARYPDFTASFAGDIAVIGLGKLGGREFNVASDCDVMFVYANSRTTNAVNSAEYFQRWGGKYTEFLESKTRLGFLYHVDARLRPHGKSAPLASSRDGFADYFRNEAQFWEKMALTRARFICGNDHIQTFLNELKEEILFSSPPNRREIESILDMRKKIESEKHQETLKAGPGGLIDVEFISQALVLCYGPTCPAVQKTATMQVLRAATAEELLPLDDAKQLITSYLFLREVENRLRIVNNISLDAIPTDRDKLEELTRRYALKLDTEKPTPDKFLGMISLHTRKVRHIFERFFNDLLHQFS